MELYFNKKIDTCCKLNFSNRILHSTKNNVVFGQQAVRKVNLDKKKQKRSLKRVFSDHKILLVKNQSLPNSQMANKAQNISQQIRQFDDYANVYANEIGQIDRNKIFQKNQKNQKTRSPKSLQISPFIRGFHTNYKVQVKKFQNNQSHQQAKSQRIQYIYPQSNQNRLFNESHYISNKINHQPDHSSKIKIMLTQIFQRNNIMQKPIPFGEQDKNQIFSQKTDKIIHLNHSSINLPQEINKIQKNNFRQGQFSDYQVLNLSPIKKNPRISFEHHFIKNNQNFSQQKSQSYIASANQACYSQNFQNIYGEVELQEEIKNDLMRSLQLQLGSFVNKNKNQKGCYQNASNQTSLVNGFKVTPSVSSTMIHSEYKFQNKKQFQNQYFDNRQFDRKGVNISHDYFFSKIQNNEKSMIGFDSHYETDNYMRYPQRDETQLQGKEKKQFQQKCRVRGKFKSIVSVNSEHQSNSSVDSIIINKHPHDFISLNPLHSLW